MAASYEQAHQQIQSILRGKLFHTYPQPVPWWVRALEWVGRHLHLNFGPTTWRAVGFVLAGLFVLSAVAVIALWLTLRRRKFVRRFGAILPGKSVQNPLSEARAALEAGRYSEMLHYLTDSMLKRAEADELIRIRRWKTLRMYRRELSGSGSGENREDGMVTMVTELASTFATLTTRAEAVWFGGETLDEAQAASLFQAVEHTLSAGRSAAS